MLTILILLSMYTGTEELRKRIADGESQVSSCRRGNLQVANGKRLE